MSFDWKRKLQLASLEWTFLNPDNFDEGFNDLLSKLKAELEFQAKEGISILKTTILPCFRFWEGERYGSLDKVGKLLWFELGVINIGTVKLL